MMEMTKRFASTVLAAMALAVPTLAVAAPAHADPDTDFYNELHIYGIYGEKDYNAWIGKIACKRLWNNLDHDANQSAQFVKRQLDEGHHHRADLSVPRCRAIGLTAPKSCRFSRNGAAGAGG